MHSSSPIANSLHISGLFLYIEHSMVFRSSAEHQPSSLRFIVWLPHLSVLIKRLGTPVSVIIMTSIRQQMASQFEQVMLFSSIFLALISMDNYSIYLMGTDYPARLYLFIELQTAHFNRYH